MIKINKTQYFRLEDLSQKDEERTLFQRQTEGQTDKHSDSLGDKFTKTKFKLLGITSTLLIVLSHMMAMLDSLCLPI